MSQIGFQATPRITHGSHREVFRPSQWRRWQALQLEYDAMWNASTAHPREGLSRACKAAETGGQLMSHQMTHRTDLAASRAAAVAP